jgi:hypothetical protein
MTARHPPGHHILFCHSTQHGLRRPPRPPCLGPYRAQMVQCWSVGQSSIGAPLRVTRHGYDGHMGRDNFNATTWHRNINYLLAETRRDNLGPPRARIISCLTPRFPRAIRRGGDSLRRVGRGKVDVHRVGMTRTCASTIRRGETRALSLAPRLQGSGAVKLVPRSSNSPGLMPRPPKQSWAFFAKADDQDLAVL